MLCSVSISGFRYKILFLQAAEDAVNKHLEAAESLVVIESGEEAALGVVTDELKIVYERFKTCLADYEVLLSMCCTFYQSVERVSLPSFV